MTTANWALENIEKAQQNEETAIKLELEWYDESVEDMTTLGRTLATRDDIAAIIGPYASSNAQAMAYQCVKTRKMMLTPTASSEEFVRTFSRSNFLWSLVETDISQCEVLLSRAVISGAKRVSLLTPDNLYGDTFKDWFAFQAQELGLEVEDVRIYNNNNIDTQATAAVRCDADYLICVVSDIENIRTILQARSTRGDKGPKLLFSDGAMIPELLSLGSLSTGVEGVAMYSDPTTGFEIAYGTRYGTAPMGAESRLYDALLLTAFAAADAFVTQEANLNESMIRVVSGSGTEMLAWDEMGMYRTFKAIEQGKYLNISGAGGSLKFDKEVHTNVLQTVYCHWSVYDGRIILLDFCSSDGGNRTDATLANWNWQVKQEQIFDNTSTGIEYKELKEQWALLVAASSTWANYRHQADVLNMYQILKRNGYTDDRIILIMEDDLAYNQSNIYPGEIRVSPTGNNLYQDIEIDYYTNQLPPADISAILAGERSERTPHVIEATDNDNVLVFWSGHGSKGQFDWLKEASGFTTSLMHNTLSQLSEERKFRKMLWLIETCYSSSVAKASVGIPGVLCIAAADEMEVSFADVYSQELSVWMSNRFTHNMTDAIEGNPTISFRDLYNYMLRNTLGSHVKVHNAALFDNLYLSSIDEFISYQRK